MIQSNVKTKILKLYDSSTGPPSYEDYLALNNALQSGDEPMDQVLRWYCKTQNSTVSILKRRCMRVWTSCHMDSELTEFFSSLNKTRLVRSSQD